MEKFNQQEINTMQGGGFLNLKAKETTIRIISRFVKFGNHFIQDTGSVICVGKEQCAYCNNPETPSRFQAFIWVIDRDESDENSQIKILRFGYTVFQQIIQLSKGIDKDGNEVEERKDFMFDEMPDYDIGIKKTGEGLETKYEVVLPQAKSALTNDEKERIGKTVTDLDMIVQKMKDKVIGAGEVKGEKDILENYPEENSDGDKVPF